MAEERTTVIALLALAHSIARTPRRGGLDALVADVRDTVAWLRELRRLNN